MTADTVFHICSRSEWDRAQAAGRYVGSDLDRRDGFIHFSTREQAVRTAALHLAGRKGLVLLEVDAGSLGAALKWEKSRNGALFPHLYGPLPTDTVRAVHDLPVGPDGAHLFPKGF